MFPDKSRKDIYGLVPSSLVLFALQLLEDIRLIGLWSVNERHLPSSLSCRILGPFFFFLQVALLVFMYFRHSFVVGHIYNPSTFRIGFLIIFPRVYTSLSCFVRSLVYHCRLSPHFYLISYVASNLDPFIKGIVSSFHTAYFPGESTCRP